MPRALPAGRQEITIALAGNPNSGKTTIFNNLTGSRLHVGNYPGVTVEKRQRRIKYKGYSINLVDLPGTYSLTAYSMDEIIARNFVVEEKPDVVIDVIDCSNLERNLYLATQFIELGVPLVLAFNMSDLAEKQGLAIDKNRLSELFGSPIVFTVANKKIGMDALLDEAIKPIEGKRALADIVVSYGREIQEEIKKLEDIIVKDHNLMQKYPSRWVAIKLLEDDNEIIKRVKQSPNLNEILDQKEKSINHLRGIFGDSPEAIIADRRYGFISGACSEAAKKTYEVRHSTSDMIDKVLVNKILGLPIFLFFMWLLFKLIFTASGPIVGWIESGQVWLGNIAGSLLPDGSIIQSLVVDGVVAGVGSVIVFVPIIFLLFLAMALLEDTGYMARVAFIMDKFMHKIGLHGRSCIPMLLGFGCNVAAILATRTIEDKRDRMVTLLVNPFMSCGARLPLYTLFIGAFFSEKIAGNTLLSLYLLGIAISVIMAKIFRRYLFKGEAEAFVMELPPYRLPTVKGLLTHMWERGSVFLKKAGTFIFVAVIIVWFLSHFPWNPAYSQDYETLITQSQGDEQVTVHLENQMSAERLEKSFAGRFGKTIAPIFKPMGFDDWKIAVGLTGGFAAKEIIVATLGTLYSTGEADESSEGLRTQLQKAVRPDGTKLFTPLVAYALMVFILLYIPCAATIAAIKMETNSWLWPLFAAVYTTSIAWIVSFIVYQGGKLLGLG
ncbi:MAG: ferrous iron transport protein B [Candidatus Omnitrophota bacterium]